jgi:hypothetical protein
VVRGKAAEGLVRVSNREWKIVEAVPNLAYITDRDYAITKLPKGMRGAHVVIRDSGRVENWIRTGEVIAERECTAYAAIMVVTMEGMRTISEAQEESLKGDGWQLLNEPFATVGASKWILLTRNVSKGEVSLPLLVLQGTRGVRVQIMASALSRAAKNPAPRSWVAKRGGCLWSAANRFASGVCGSCGGSAKLTSASMCQAACASSCSTSRPGRTS